LTSFGNTGGFTWIKNEKTGSYIKYDLKNPKLMMDKNIEVKGDISKSEDGLDYVNKVQVMKID
jgi:hypothetical protein